MVVEPGVVVWERIHNMIRENKIENYNHGDQGFLNQFFGTWCINLNRTRCGTWTSKIVTSSPLATRHSNAERFHSSGADGCGICWEKGKNIHDCQLGDCKISKDKSKCEAVYVPSVSANGLADLNWCSNYSTYDVSKTGGWPQFSTYLQIWMANAPVAPQYHTCPERWCQLFDTMYDCVNSLHICSNTSHNLFSLATSLAAVKKWGLVF